MTRATLPSLLATLSLATAYPCRVLSSDDEVRSRFRSAYEPHAKDVVEAFASAEIRLAGEARLGNGKIQGDETVVRINGGFSVAVGKTVLWDKDKKKKISSSSERVEGRNRQYAFQLVKTREEGYVLAGVTLHDDAKSPMPVVCLPYADPATGATFLDIVNDRGVEFVGFQGSVWQDEASQELKVRYTRDPVKSKPVKVSTSYFFSPSLGWACRGKRTVDELGKDRTVVEDVCHYSTPPGGEVPTVSKLERWVKTEDRPAQSRLLFSEQVVEFKRVPPIPEGEFRLTAFGLPEPQGMVAAPQGRPWAWMLGAAAGFLALCGVFRWLARRRGSRRATRGATYPSTPDELRGTA